jgi:hypothetical protein
VDQLPAAVRGRKEGVKIQKGGKLRKKNSQRGAGLPDWGAKSTNSALLSALGGDSELPTTDNATTNILDNNKKYIIIYLD